MAMLAAGQSAPGGWLLRAFDVELSYESVSACGGAVGANVPSRPLSSWGDGDGAVASVAALSAWLAAFRSSDWPRGAAIEIPGQYERYDGSEPPARGAHATLRAVEPALLCLESLRRPKRLALLDAADRRHLFLLKGGEDLRCDQRVQALLRAVNARLREAPGTRRIKERPSWPRRWAPASCLATTPPPPGLFSITTLCPSSSYILAEMMRAVTSVDPPGPNATIILIVCVG